MGAGRRIAVFANCGCYVTQRVHTPGHTQMVEVLRSGWICGGKIGLKKIKEKKNNNHVCYSIERADIGRYTTSKVQTSKFITGLVNFGSWCMLFVALGLSLRA